MTLGHVSRIVSLLPSATEIVCLLGAGARLVGRSHECDFPEGSWGGGFHARLAEVPVLTAARVGSKLGEAVVPGAIDAAVRGAMARRESLYTLDEAALARLKPDLIITQDLCEVCSIDLATVRRVVAGMTPQPAVLSLNPQTMEDVLDDVLRVAEAIGEENAGMRVVAELRERLYAANEFVNPFADGPVVGFLEWTEPLFIAGHWTVQLIERAGGRHPLNPGVPAASAGAAIGPQMAERRAGKSIRVPAEAFAATKPDYVVVAPCGLSLEQTRACVAALAETAWWKELPAVKGGKGRVALVDGNQMFNRPGPRLVEAYQWLVGWLNDRPELIPAGFPWEVWEGT